MYKTLGFILLGAAGVWQLTKSHVDSNLNALENLSFRLLGINNLRLSGGNINFTTDIAITNPTQDSFTFSYTSKVILQKLSFYDKNGRHIGDAFPNLSQVNILPQQTVEIKDIPASIPLSNFGETLSSAYSIFLDTDNLETKAELSVLGRTVII